MYTNFCRVTGTPEELIIDFGLNPQPFGVPTVPIPVTQRIITNFFTAKRMLHALMMTVQRHEATFGVIETNVHAGSIHRQPAIAAIGVCLLDLRLIPRPDGVHRLGARIGSLMSTSRETRVAAG